MFSIVIVLPSTWPAVEPAHVHCIPSVGPSRLEVALTSMVDATPEGGANVSLLMQLPSSRMVNDPDRNSSVFPSIDTVAGSFFPSTVTKEVNAGNVLPLGLFQEFLPFRPFRSIGGGVIRYLQQNGTCVDPGAQQQKVVLQRLMDQSATAALEPNSLIVGRSEGVLKELPIDYYPPLGDRAGFTGWKFCCWR